MLQAIQTQSRPAPWNKGKLIGQKLVFKKASKLHRSEADVPHDVVDLFESDMLADAGDGDFVIPLLRHWILDLGGQQAIR